MNDKIKELIAGIDREVKSLSFGQEPENLYAPIGYMLDLKGKRIRPLLTLLAYRLFHEDHSRIMQTALSVEVFHNFTLLHDDIMDKAPLRRGMQTVHNRWNENIAILSGDVMLVRVYDLLLTAPDHLVKRVISAFNDCAAGVCEGQQLDMDFESRESVTEEEYIHMIQYKTAILLGFSLALGGILAESTEEDVRLLNDLGIRMGIGFQLMDDLLDVYGDHEKFGKQAGGDIISNKKTYLLIKALERAEGKQYEELVSWIRREDFNDAEKVRAVKSIYDDQDISGLTREKMNTYFQIAFSDLEGISAPEEKKQDLRDIIHFLMQREI